MKSVFKGRAILGGHIKGKAIVSSYSLNLLATYGKSVLPNYKLSICCKQTKKAVCSDKNNPDLYEKVISKKIICLPQTIGSTSGGVIIQMIAKQGIQPLAFLFSESIDSLAASGIVLSEVWNNKRIITIDGLGSDFLKTVKNDDNLEIKEDGTVIIL